MDGHMKKKWCLGKAVDQLYDVLMFYNPRARNKTGVRLKDRCDEYQKC